MYQNRASTLFGTIKSVNPIETTQPTSSPGEEDKSYYEERK